MANETVLHLVLDTSYLRAVSLNDPDFRKLLRFSQEDVVKIFVPHIVWEERRTQLAERTLKQLRQLRDQIEALKGPWLSGLVQDGLVPSSLEVCADNEVDIRSKEAMAAFAKSYKIEIVPLGADHADRAWTRYFEVGVPFSSDQDRESRRKDIPDSWIFEAVIDLKQAYDSLVAACNDDKLTGALASVGITVLKGTEAILGAIDAALSRAAPELSAEPTSETSPVETVSAAEEKKLESALARASDRRNGVDKKILGYVGFLRSPSKEQLFDLLATVGIEPSIARNAAERLVFEGLIKDTGNHFLPADEEACAIAASLVEPEIILLLDSP